MRAACGVILVLLVFFPAAAVARIGPGAHPSAQTSIPPVGGGDIPSAQQTSKEMDTIYSTNDHHHRLSSSSLRRELVGSSPPTCVGRCGACAPCKPVHVAITSPHAVTSGTDYYPEVWRCLCGNMYYMP